jgi:tetrapyrrole methylase family protein/MazG family protein
MAEAERGAPQVTPMGAALILDAVLARNPLGLARGVLVLDPAGLSRRKFDPGGDLLILNVDDRRLAAEVKLRLLERYPADHEVRVFHAPGPPGSAALTAVALGTMDGCEYDQHTSVHVPGLPGSSPCPPCRYPLDGLVEIMQTLRRRCPWDREQDHLTLRSYVLEEAYELVDAIESGSSHKLAEELGDLLLQVVFHCVIGMEEGAFDLNRVADGVEEKLRRRHPHVFGDSKVRTTQGVLAQWSRLKAEEAGDILGNIPRSLPALMRAARVQSRASAAGLGEEVPGGLAAVLSEHGGSEERALGELLLGIARTAAARGADPEMALHRATDRLVDDLNQKVKAGRSKGEQG